MRSGTKPRTWLAQFLMIAVATPCCGGCSNPQGEPATAVKQAEPESTPAVSMDDSRTDSPDRVESEPSETSVVESPAESVSGATETEAELQAAETAPATTSNGAVSITEKAPVELTDQSRLPVPESMPKVVMTQAHAASCLVKVGDPFPELTLNDPRGEPTTLESLRGDALTVVLFWNASTPYGVAQLRDLETDVRKRFDSLGVSVVGIDVGDSAEAVRDIASDKGVTYPQLLDSDGSLYRQVATRFIPRVYLLDTNGTVLWFDLEYSVATRRHLLQAIRFQIES